MVAENQLFLMFSLSSLNVSPKASEKHGIEGADFENYAPEIVTDASLLN